MGGMRMIVAIGAALAGAAPASAAYEKCQPAFPTAEGAGACSAGGRGGKILRVTTLADAGPGSLRAAVETTGPRVIIFDIGGTITLLKPLKIREPRVTIAGQTAPGGGITLRGQPLLVDADDVVIRFLRSRLGDEEGVETDAVTVERGRRIILDHISASWSVDETLSVGIPQRKPEDDIRDVTIQWSIIAESLDGSIHAKGEHGYGSLIRAAHGAEISFHHNLWAHHIQRMPRPGNYMPPAQDPEGPRIEFRSNVFYNWGGARSGYNADSGEKASHSAYAFIDNSYRTGPSSKAAIAFDEGDPLARSLFAGNAMNGVVPADPMTLVTGIKDPANRIATLAIRPVCAQGWAESEKAVLAHAGASLVRDAVDLRIVRDVTAGTGGIVNSQKQVGGWPELAPGTAWRDGDGDGLPDDWERAHKLDPADPADAARPAGGGYSHLDAWLEELATTRR